MSKLKEHDATTSGLDSTTSPMPIETQCPKCGKKYRVKDELAGRKIRCKECGAPIPVEDPFAVADEDWDDDSYGYEDDDGYDEAGYDEPAPKPRRRKKGTKSRGGKSSTGKPAWKLPVGVLGMVACLGLLVFSVYSIFTGQRKAVRATVGSVFGLIFCFNLAFGSED